MLINHHSVTTMAVTCKRGGGQFLVTKACVSGCRHNPPKPSCQTMSQGQHIVLMPLHETVRDQGMLKFSSFPAPSSYWISVLGSQSTHQESTKANNFVSAQQADFSNQQEFITALVRACSLGTEHCKLFGDTPFPIN